MPQKTWGSNGELIADGDIISRLWQLVNYNNGHLIGSFSLSTYLKFHELIIYYSGTYFYLVKIYICIIIEFILCITLILTT